MLPEQGAREEDYTIRCVAVPASGGEEQTTYCVLEALSLDYSPEQLGAIVRAVRDGRTIRERKVDDDGVEWTLTFSVIDPDRLEEDIAAWVTANRGEALRAGLAD